MYYCESFLNARSMSSVTYLRLIALIYIVHPCGLLYENSSEKIESSFQQQFKTIYGLTMAQQC